MKHNHKEGQECEYCKNGIEATLKKEAKMIKKHGWFVHFVHFGSPDVPYGMNVHTHGLKENLDHLDLQICLSMPPESCHSILVTAIEDNIKNGKSFEAGKKYEDIIASGPNHKGMKYKVLFLEAEENGRKVLRMIFPDKDGGFDGDMSKQLDGCIIPDGTILSAEVANIS